MKEIRQENADAWDIAAEIYWRDLERDVESLRNGTSSMLLHEQNALESVACSGTAFHLQCAGGTDTLSLHLHGFSHVCGIDISSEMIKVCEKKSSQLNWSADWICSDVLEIDSTLHQVADMVYTGRGALPWVTDIAEWACVVRRLLKPRGYLIVHEGHPLDWVWDNSRDSYMISESRGNYFADDHELGDDRWPNSFVKPRSSGPKRPVAREKQWTLAQVVQAPIDAGLQLISLKEHPEPFWNLFENMPVEEVERLPHSFTAIWQLSS